MTNLSTIFKDKFRRVGDTKTCNPRRDVTEATHHKTITLHDVPDRSNQTNIPASGTVQETFPGPS